MSYPQSSPEILPNNVAGQAASKGPAVVVRSIRFQPPTVVNDDPHTVVKEWKLKKPLAVAQREASLAICEIVEKTA